MSFLSISHAYLTGHVKNLLGQDNDRSTNWHKTVSLLSWTTKKCSFPSSSHNLAWVAFGVCMCMCGGNTDYCSSWPQFCSRLIWYKDLLLTLHWSQIKAFLKNYEYNLLTKSTMMVLLTFKYLPRSKYIIKSNELSKTFPKRWNWPLDFDLALGEQGLVTWIVSWHSALYRAFFRVPERAFRPVAASHPPQLSNLYLQSARRESKHF